jgi:integrase
VEGLRVSGKLYRLTATEVRNAKVPGFVHDGGGLFLQVAARSPKTDPAGVSKSWVFRFTSPTVLTNSGKRMRREMGLGSADRVTLGDARRLADAARKVLSEGDDPIERRKAVQLARIDAAEAARRAITFRQASERYLDAQRRAWRTEKQAKLWAASMAAYAYPVLGEVPVSAVDVGRVLEVLEPIWFEKPETAARIRQRVEAVLDWAAVRGHRAAENPARWRGHLEKTLPARAKPVRHHPALPYEQMAAFMKALRAIQGSGALALELCILTASRSTETLNARWREFDLEAALWTIPADRMKAKRAHRVPLSAQAVALLARLKQAAHPGADLLFPGQGTGRALSGMSMLAVLRRMERTDITVHGFRSTFRDWAGEVTNFPREVAEAALAHVLPDKTEAAYRRGDALEKRRLMMQSWADFCEREGAVVSLHEHASRARGGER